MSDAKKQPSDPMIIAARGIVETHERLGRPTPPRVVHDSQLMTSYERRNAEDWAAAGQG